MGSNFNLRLVQPMDEQSSLPLVQGASQAVLETSDDLKAGRKGAPEKDMEMSMGPLAKISKTHVF